MSVCGQNIGLNRPSPFIHCVELKFLHIGFSSDFSGFYFSKDWFSLFNFGSIF